MSELATALPATRKKRLHTVVEVRIRLQICTEEVERMRRIALRQQPIRGITGTH